MTARSRQGWLATALLGAARFVLAFAIYSAAELLCTRGFGLPGMPLSVVLLSTGLVAGVFWLTRRPLRRIVGRVVLGEQAEGYEAGRALLGRMATTLAVDEIVPALAEAAGRTMHSNRAEVRLLLSDGEPWSEVWPQRATADGSPVTVDVRHAGAAVGEIEVDVADAGEQDRDRMLLGELARPAGLALSTVRLTVELRRRAADLQDVTAELARSNQRIIDARRTAIARLGSEMRDRVLPHLDRAQAALASGVAGGDSEGDDGQDGPARFDLARTEVAAALEALRILGRGIYPPRLADAGLEVSLQGWQQRSGIGVDLRVLGDQDALHGNTDLESCLYFALVTALGVAAVGGQRPAAVVHIDPAEVHAQVTVPVPGGSDGLAGSGSVGSDSVGSGGLGGSSGFSGSGGAQDRAVVAVQDRIGAFGGLVESVTESGTGPGSERGHGGGRLMLRIRVPMSDSGWPATDPVVARPLSTAAIGGAGGEL